MHTRRFGRTGLQVSELAFGGGYVGGLLILADDATRRRALARAFAAGINWIDTAPLYGQGRSEEALGWLLAEFGERPYLSTKVNLDTAKLHDIPGEIERSIHASLKRLRRESVDLLQLHNPIAARPMSGAVRMIGLDDALHAADGLERMKSQGLTRFIGLTALGETPAVIRAIDSGRFDTAQVYYNLLNPSAARAMPSAWSGHDFSGVIAACKRHDVGIMNIRVLASGVLASDVRHGREVVITESADLDTEQRRAASVFKALGSSYGTRAQTAVRFALANPDLATVVVGLAELGHLEEALAAQAKGPLPAEAIARLESVYTRGFER
jgi:L-galactose dehydrogenase/L-glyceraldehyde 3-phosphate reductase